MTQGSGQLVRWIDGQRVGSRAMPIVQCPGVSAEQEDLFQLLSAYLRHPLQDGRMDESDSCAVAAPPSLSLLKRAISLRGRLPESFQPAVDAHEWLVGIGDPAPFTRAQIWVHHLLLGALSATQLMRLEKTSICRGRPGRRPGEAKWRDIARDEGFRHTIEEAIEVLRAPQGRGHKIGSRR